MIGMGVSLANVQRIGTGVFNPATLSPSGWWRDYGGASPWVGQAGGSLVSAAAPTAGTPVNGVAPATFNGSTQSMASASAISTFLSASQFGLAYLVKHTAVPADAGTGLRYGSGRPVVSDGGGGYLHSGANVAGVFGGIYDSGYKDAQAAATPLNNWIAVFIKLVGGTLYVAANNGAYATASIADIDVVTGVLTVGSAYAAPFLQGDLLEVLTRATAWTDQERTDLYSYFKARYPSAGLP